MDLHVFDNYKIQILSKHKFKLYSLCTKKKKNMTIVPIDGILSNLSIVMSITKVEFCLILKRNIFIQ